MPLLGKKERLEREISDLRNITFLIAKKKILEKEIKNLRMGKELKVLSLRDIYELAKTNGITILEIEALTEKGISVKKIGQNLYLSKGISKKNKEDGQVKASGIRGALSIYRMKVIASKDNLYKFFKAITENRMTFVAGFYHGCMSGRDFIRRKNPPMVCEIPRSDYKKLLCSKDVSKIPEYIITIVSLKVED
jgi:hypothetical protein